MRQNLTRAFSWSRKRSNRALLQRGRFGCFFRVVVGLAVSVGFFLARIFVPLVNRFDLTGLVADRIATVSKWRVKREDSVTFREAATMGADAQRLRPVQVEAAWEGFDQVLITSLAHHDRAFGCFPKSIDLAGKTEPFDLFTASWVIG